MKDENSGGEDENELLAWTKTKDQPKVYKNERNKEVRGIKGVNSEGLVRLSVLLTLSPQPCPGMRCLLCPPLLG